MPSSEKFYNAFSSIYPLVDIFLKAQKERLFESVNSMPEGKVLEIGVGNGSHLHLYKKHTVVAIDTSVKMLKDAQRHKTDSIDLLYMSGEDLKFDDEAFDYIVLSHVVSVVPNIEILMEEVFRVLKPNGKVFILNHFTPNNVFKYADRVFEPFSKFFHFKSLFVIDDIKGIEKFRLEDEVTLGYFSYYKLLTFIKT